MHDHVLGRRLAQKPRRPSAARGHHLAANVAVLCELPDEHEHRRAAAVESGEGGLEPEQLLLGRGAAQLHVVRSLRAPVELHLAARQPGRQRRRHPSELQLEQSDLLLHPLHAVGQTCIALKDLCTPGNALSSGGCFGRLVDLKLHRN